jgi:hypothetical protein
MQTVNDIKNKFINLLSEYYECDIYHNDIEDKYQTLHIYYSIKCSNSDKCECRKCENAKIYNHYANEYAFEILHDKIIKLSEQLNANNLKSTLLNDYNDRLKNYGFEAGYEDRITFNIKHRNNQSEVKRIIITIDKM